MSAVAVVLAACGDDEPGSPEAREAVDEMIEEGEWDLEVAARPYEGVTITAPFLDRPGYHAAIEMVPEFEELTGINVEWDITPYEDRRQTMVLDFTGGTDEYDIVLVDVVWVGEFAESGWMVPLEEFTDNPALTDPDLNIDGFAPVILESFGEWNDVLYGLPFDNYSGVLYYNTCLLEEAGFDGPPQTWEELLDEYAPALTGDGQYAFALQSRRGEAQSADSFARMVRAFGGDLFDPETFEPALSEPAALEGLRFRQELMDYMPPGVVEFEHDETVQAFAQGQVAMITEWTNFWPTLADPESSDVVDCLGVDLEPAGPDNVRSPALGGFSLGVNSNSSQEQQEASWLFIQWITSEAKAEEYIEAGGVTGRMSAYEDAELQEQNPYFAPTVESWESYADPTFRPRFPEWPQLSEVIGQYGSEMMTGGVTIEEGVEQIEGEMEEILAPYLEGDKELVQ